MKLSLTPIHVSVYIAYMPIRILEQQVIARIAAGEVVERPASVVKELVENSLDAGSSQITVETATGGVSLIRVTDNGSGIPSAELELAFERHATSKVSSLADLESISSLGFRGEALPSIAAVSDIEVSTRTASETDGSFISIKSGRLAERRTQARTLGATIAVKNLLHNVPARLKFLKSHGTENSHISNVVSQYALAYPEVKLTLIADGRTVLKTPGSGNLADSIREVYGAEIAQGMLPIENTESQWQSGQTEPQITVSGMVGAPSVNRSSRDYLSFFINRRWVNSRLLSWAVEEAYHGLLMQGRHPVAVICISIPPSDTDINIHPSKTEVKFRDERAVFSSVQRAVRRVLIAQAPVPSIEEVAAEYRSPAAGAQTAWSPAANYHSQSQPIAATPSRTLPALRLLGQAAGCYIIAEGPDGVYLIDQHAAHERIVFEKTMEQIACRRVEIQGLLEPFSLEVSPMQNDALKTGISRLAEAGYSLEPFGERTYMVRAVPLLLSRQDWNAALLELIDALSSESEADWREKLAISFACHGAIRAGKSLSPDEMRELLLQLEQTASPNTCPHGRPTLIRLTISQLEKEFHRI